MVVCFCYNFQIVNGPEILSKYVGESESNIRDLFEDAEEEQEMVIVTLVVGLLSVVFHAEVKRSSKSDQK